jgi:alpha-tubulin suppressor-like RCC1 family protein
VEVLDAGGNLVEGAAIDVSTAIADNPGGGQLSGTTVVRTSNGLASFTDLKIDKVGIGYTLRASAQNLSGSTSQPFDVSVGPPSLLLSSVATGPQPLMAGDTTLVTVQIRDAGGNAVPGGVAGLQMSLAGGTVTGSFGSVQELGGGAYATVFTASGFGTPAQIYLTFGDGQTGAPGPTIAVIGFVEVSISNFNACAAANTGDAYCWGRGYFGALGVGSGDYTSRLKPTKVSGGISWLHVGAGGDVTCGLATTHRVYCWGASGDYATGISAPSDPAVPQVIDGSYLFSALAVGWDMGACGITTTTLPICWGLNSWGQVGTGSASVGEPPSVVAGQLTFAAIGRDIFNSCGITADGTTYCWGSNLDGGLGVADSTLGQSCNGQKCSPVPLAVPGATGMAPASLSVGQNHICALKPDGSAYCWGNGGVDNGQASPAEAMPTSLRFRQFVTGNSLYCGIATDDTTYCWGGNAYGQTGSGSFSGSLTDPTPITLGVKLVQLDAGIGEVCGVAANGRAYCWGGNLEGQLGDGTTVDRAVPTLVQSVR